MCPSVLLARPFHVRSTAPSCTTAATSIELHFNKKSIFQTRMEYFPLLEYKMEVKVDLERLVVFKHFGQDFMYF